MPLPPRAFLKLTPGLFFSFCGTRSLSRRASGADSLAGSDSYDRSAYTVVVALGVLGVAAAAAGVAVVMARARRT